MQSNYSKKFATLLLVCICIVFVHLLIPHSHGIVRHSEAKHFQAYSVHDEDHHATDHSHSIFSEFLDFFRDFSHPQIGEHHLAEYVVFTIHLSTSQHYNHFSNAWIQDNPSLSFATANGFSVVKPQLFHALKTYQAGKLYRRGPPNRS